jgi:hypothetical protein
MQGGRGGFAEYRSDMTVQYEEPLDGWMIYLKSAYTTRDIPEQEHPPADL